MPRSVIGGAGSILRVPSKRSPRSSVVISAGGDSFDADAQAFFTAAGITDATQKTAVNDLVVAMKADGIWSKMRAIYPFVGGSSSTHAVNLKSPGTFDITWSGTVTHDANGITGNGSDGQGDTGVTDTDLTAADHGLSVYCRTNIPSGGQIGNQNTTGGFSGFFASLGSLTYGYLADLNNVTVSDGGDTLGLYTISRSSTTEVNFFKDGAALGTNPKASTGGTALGTTTIRVLMTNGQFTNANIALAAIHAGLTSGEAADFNTSVANFQTALGRNV